MHIESTSIDTLNVAKYNPRKDLKSTDAEYVKLKNSVEHFGYVDPVIVNKRTMTVVGGHQRLKVLKDLGYKDIDVVYVDLDDKDEKALNIALNKISGDWDADKLEDLLRDINLDANYDIELTGFSLDEIQTLFNGSLDNINIENDEDNNDEDNEDDNDEDEEEPDEEDTQVDNKDIHIKKLQKNYGIPYMGNKSRLADIIISILPPGERLVDLFGGGGAITHCGILYKKWNKYLYNDINSLITTFFKDVIDGKYKDGYRVIDRETFNKLKDTDPYVKYIWSFGNEGKSYLWSKEKEQLLLDACHVCIDKTINDRRLALKHLLKKVQHGQKVEQVQSLERLKNLQSLEALNRVQSLEELKSLQSLIEITNISYEQYKHLDGDVVYCDIPYEHKDEKTGQFSNCDNYGTKDLFNNLEFYEWCKEQPYQVFFSSYEISDNSFYKVRLKKIQRIMGSKTNSNSDIEYLYSNRPIDLSNLK